MRLARLAAVHLLVWLVAFSLFAATDSWSALTGLGLAALLSVITGILAGLATTTLVHEWFHLLGARYCGARYDIPASAGLFVYDWDFTANSPRQFLVMSVAGSIGGALAVVLLWLSLPTDTAGRAAVLAAAISSFAFAAAIEWPVLLRTRSGGDPLAELSKTDKGVLTRSFLIGSAVGLVSFVLVY